MKHIVNLFFALLLTFTIAAQGIDKERMHRDLEVAEKALNTVLIDKKEQYPMGLAMRNSSVEAGYVQDFGVVFNVNMHVDHAWTVHRIKETKSLEVGSNEKQKDHNKEEKSSFVENSKMFLADYAGIIGQLNDDERISIRRGAQNGHHNHINDVYVASMKKEAGAKGVGKVFVENMESMSDSELIVEVSAGKVKELQRGSISRSEFLKSVEVIENEVDYEEDMDLETLSAMFHRLYKKDLAQTYYTIHEPRYSKLSNFGVIIKMKVYSSFEDDNLYYMPTIDKDNLTLEERNNHVESLLPQFETDFKDNLVNYGRTLKNLDSDEILMFEVKMTACKGCKNFPRVMKFSVKKSVLHEYNRGQLSMKQAIESVDVDRIM